MLCTRKLSRNGDNKIVSNLFDIVGELDQLFSFDLRTFYVKSHYLISLLMTAGAGWLPLNHSCVAAMIGIMQLIICVETAGG